VSRGHVGFLTICDYLYKCPEQASWQAIWYSDHPSSPGDVSFYVLMVFAIGDSPTRTVVVWLIVKTDFTLIYISQYVVNIKLYLRKTK
jgi:hypothetical protein